MCFFLRFIINYIRNIKKEKENLFFLGLCMDKNKIKILGIWIEKIVDGMFS